MIPWIQVYSNLTTHRKTGRLADELGLANSFVSPDVVAVGILISLWTWAVQNASNGDISDCSARAIAEACRWRKKPEQLVAALKNAGWVDSDGKLHDWEEYACLLMEQEDNRKAKTRERVQRYREKKKASESEACNGDSNVTDTSCNAPTIPDITIPNITNNNSFYLSERKEEKKERDNSAWFNAETWVKLAKMAKELDQPDQMQVYIKKAAEFGAIIDPITMEVRYEKA